MTKDDLIDRQAALDAISAWRRDYPLDLQEPIDDCWNSVRELPAAQPDHTADIGKKADGDCIGRREAIETLRAYFVDNFDYYIEDTKWIDEVLGTVPAAQPEQRWIPCSERLPYAEYGESDNVLATCGYRDVEDGSIRWIKTLYFNGGNWCHPTGETYLEKVYAWMPLPKPYRGGDSD